MIPQPQYNAVMHDITTGLTEWRLWSRMGWLDVKRRYRRTTIGPFWSTFSLALFIFTLGFVWAKLWGQDVHTYLPFLAAGLLTWTLVSTLLNEGCSVMMSAFGLIKQRQISYTMLVCSMIWRNLIVFTHNLIILVVIDLILVVPVGWPVLLLFPGIVLLVINALWLGLLLGLFCARFGDIQQLIASILGIALFLTPIFWTPSQLGGRFQIVVHVNFLYHLIEIIREPLLGKMPELWSYIFCILAAITGWAFTIFVYARFRRRIPFWL